MIPEIIHRVVPTQIPDRFEAFWERTRELHPQWECHTWQDPIDPAGFELGYLFERCSSGAQLAGLVRVELLWRYGGVYVDMDIEPLRPFDELLDVAAFVGTEDGTILTDAVMAAEPGHAGFRACMDRLLETDMAAGALATGPLLVTSVLSGRDDVLVLPPRYFYPAKFTGLQESRDAIVESGRSYAIHHWHRSWNEPRLLNLGETTRQQLAAKALEVRGATRRRAKGLLTSVKDRWSRLTPQALSPQTSFFAPGRVLTVTKDGTPLLVPTEPGSIRAPELVEGLSMRGVGTAVSMFVDRADSVLITDDCFGLATITAAHQVGPHGLVYVREHVVIDEVTRDNLLLHDLSDSAGVVVPVRDATAISGLASCSRRSLPVSLVIGSSASESIAFLQDLFFGLPDPPVPCALLIDVPDERSGHSANGLDQLLRELSERWRGNVFLAKDSGALEPIGLERVLVERGFDAVLLKATSNPDR